MLSRVPSVGDKLSDTEQAKYVEGLIQIGAYTLNRWSLEDCARQRGDTAPAIKKSLATITRAQFTTLTSTSLTMLKRQAVRAEAEEIGACIVRMQKEASTRNPATRAGRAVGLWTLSGPFQTAGVVLFALVIVALAEPARDALADVGQLLEIAREDRLSEAKVAASENISETDDS